MRGCKAAVAAHGAPAAGEGCPAQPSACASFAPLGLPGAHSRSLPWRSAGPLCVRFPSTDHLVLLPFELKTNTPILVVVSPARGEAPASRSLALGDYNGLSFEARR